MSWEEKKAYVRSLVQKTEIKRRRVFEDSRRNVSLLYFLKDDHVNIRVCCLHYQNIQLSKIPEKDDQMANPKKNVLRNDKYKNLEGVKAKYIIQKEKHPVEKWCTCLSHQERVKSKPKPKPKRLKPTPTKKQVKKENNGSETVSENDDWIPPKKRNVGKKKPQDKTSNKPKSQDNTTDSEKKKPVKKRKPKVQFNEVVKKIKKEKLDDLDGNDVKGDLDFKFDNSDFDDSDTKEEQPGKKRRRRRNIKLDLVKIEKFVNLNEFPEPVTCKQCKEVFLAHLDLGMHSIVHSLENLYSCHMCDFTNDKKSLIKNHIRTHDLWKCEKCSKIFKSKRCAYKHSKTHNVKSLVQCDICGKDVRNVYLDTHKKLVHADEKTVQIYKCHLCDKAYKNSTALKGHYSYNHKEYGVDTSVICDICGMRLSCKGKLGQHLRTHTGDRPFPCTVCPRKFISKDILRAHMRVHTGEKPYICMYCGKKFAHGAPYRYHIKTHTGEKSFICTLCGKGFISRANMRIHMRSCTLPVKLFNESFPILNK
uniref:Zinc finger protein 391-like n=1 Tax=Diabrotica virgifera virgifera TaxID=50390 RepID=A0A6P7F0F7_DIAVI